jgi:hypothetical protein
MEKLYLLKLFEEWWEREIEENGGGAEFKYEIFNIL